MGVEWYDKNGALLTDMDDIESKLQDTEYKRVGYTETGAYDVSTVWLGLDHGFGSTPQIFETMVFEHQESTMEPVELNGKVLFEGGHKYHKSLDGFTRRYATYEQAKEGHEAVVKEVQKGTE